MMTELIQQLGRDGDALPMCVIICSIVFAIMTYSDEEEKE